MFIISAEGDIELERFCQLVEGFSISRQKRVFELQKNSEFLHICSKCSKQCSDPNYSIIELLIPQGPVVKKKTTTDDVQATPQVPIQNDRSKSKLKKRESKRKTNLTEMQDQEMTGKNSNSETLLEEHY